MNSEFEKLARDVEIKTNACHRSEAILLRSLASCSSLKVQITGFLGELKDMGFIPKGFEDQVDFFEGLTPSEASKLKNLIGQYRFLRIAEGQLSEMEIKLIRGE